MVKNAGGFVAMEAHSIDFIPLDERHGQVKTQGSFWFTGNFQIISVSVGFIGPGLGLAFAWSALAGVLGVMFGTIFMALHATQGPVLGLPQMIQSRAQFGYRGVILPLLATLVGFIGFNVICALIVMDGLHSLLGLDRRLVLGLVLIIAAVPAVYGHDWIHRVFNSLFWVSLPVLALLSAAIIIGRVPSVHLQTGGWSTVAFAVQFAACASYNISYAPYVSDYSRYLPRDTKAAPIILSVFLGASLSASWLVLLGAWLSTHLRILDPLVALTRAGNLTLPHFGDALALDSCLVVIAVIAMNNYSGMLTLVTALSSFKNFRVTRGVRMTFVAIMSLAWCLISFIISPGAVSNLSILLSVVLYVLVPWTAVNLVDFFLVSEQNFETVDIFEEDGVYGRWAWRGLTGYALGSAAIVPFAVLPGFWTGPFAVLLGGVDMGWLSGLLVAGGSYYLINFFYPARKAEAPGRDRSIVES